MQVYMRKKLQKKREKDHQTRQDRQVLQYPRPLAHCCIAQPCRDPSGPFALRQHRV